MSLSGIFLNAFIITATLAAIRIAQKKWHSIYIGIAAAAILLLIFTAARQLIPVSFTAGTLWILLTVLLEESVKCLIVHNTAPTDALCRGISLASAEHTLYLLIPASAFLLRFALAGSLHTATVLLYSLYSSRFSHTNRKLLYYTFLLLLIGACTLLHTAFNIRIRSLA